jgi:hypothetical protein
VQIGDFHVPLLRLTSSPASGAAVSNGQPTSLPASRVAVPNGCLSNGPHHVIDWQASKRADTSTLLPDRPSATSLNWQTSFSELSAFRDSIVILESALESRGSHHQAAVVASSGSSHLAPTPCDPLAHCPVVFSNVSVVQTSVVTSPTFSECMGSCTTQWVALQNWACSLLSAPEYPASVGSSQAGDCRESDLALPMLSGSTGRLKLLLARPSLGSLSQCMQQLVEMRTCMQLFLWQIAMKRRTHS